MSSAPSGASAASCSGRERSSFLDWLMSSLAESQPPSPAPLRESARLLAVCERWNRKLHFYSGLFLIVFLWLFAFTGLLLNHPNWTFHESWRNRHETKFQLAIVPPAAGLTSDLDQAREFIKKRAASRSQKSEDRGRSKSEGK